MAALVRFLQSTILSKVVMAGTGLVLVLFLLGHMAGNLQMYFGQEKMNVYAETLQSLGGLLWVIRAFLLLCLVLHVITSIRLKALNLSARPVPYTIKATVRASLTSRTMIWTGALIFFFLAYHLLHFTIRVTNPIYAELIDVAGRMDVYTMVVLGFQDVLITVTYVISMLLLGFHLFHAIASMFQTLGVNHPRYTPMIETGSAVLAGVIVLGFLSIPFGVLFGWIALPAGVIV